MPDQKKVNFHHWVGMLVHRGARLWPWQAAPLDGASVVELATPIFLPVPTVCAGPLPCLAQCCQKHVQLFMRRRDILGVAHYIMDC